MKKEKCYGVPFHPSSFRLHTFGLLPAGQEHILQREDEKARFTKVLAREVREVRHSTATACPNLPGGRRGRC